MSATAAPLMRTVGVSKSFSGVPALTDVSIDCNRNEVLAVVGENGAGKSTLMKVVAGVHPSGSYEGELQLDGEPVRFSGVRDAERAGVVLVPQELRIAPELSIAENMFLGHLPRRGMVVDWDALHDRAVHWLSFFGIELEPEAHAGLLAASEQRLAAIAGSLSHEASLLILDEPTAAITEGEAERLFEHMRRLRDQGLAVVFITHRLDEVERIADRVVVMRNGELVARVPDARGHRDTIVTAMIGRALGETVPRSTGHADEVVMSVADLCVRDPYVPDKERVSSASFELFRGELLGLYGLVGAGRTELARALFGSWPGRVAGDSRVDGAEGLPRSPQEALRRGVAMLTEDRKATGLIPGHSVNVNISASSLGAVSHRGLLDTDEERRRNQELVRLLDVRPPDLDVVVDSLSGGNQQKVLLARWLALEPRVLILDEPTLGVDVGSRFEIYALLRRLAEQGMAVLLISSDVDEVLNECDRIVVMYKGRLVGEFPGDSHRHELVTAATGGNDDG